MCAELALVKFFWMSFVIVNTVRRAHLGGLIFGLLVGFGCLHVVFRRLINVCFLREILFI